MRELLKLKANAIMKWPAGLCLEARTRVFVMLPPAIIVPGEKIGTIIELSDDNAQVAFGSNSEQADSFEYISIELKPGVSMRLNRSAEAIVKGFEGDEIEFRVI